MVILLKIYTFFYGLGKARCKKGVVTDFTPRKSFLQTSILINLRYLFTLKEGKKEERKEGRKKGKKEQRREWRKKSRKEGRKERRKEGRIRII